MALKASLPVVAHSVKAVTENERDVPWFLTDHDINENLPLRNTAFLPQPRGKR